MNSIKNRALMVGAAFVGFVVLGAAPAAAQATRTWISGVGDDVNPCSRTAPCKTFAGAISKTAAGGEINCLDPGGFGGVTITKAMTLICDTVEGGILVSGSPGITINAGDNDVVTLSGLDIFGPTTAPGTNGINFINGAGLNVRNVTIKGFSQQGISFNPGAGDTSFLNLNNVVITGNGTPGDATTGAIKVAPLTGATANVVITDTRVQGNVNAGLRLDLTGTTTTRINVQVSDSTFNNDGVGIIMKAAAGTGVINALFTSNLISGNATNGVLGNGAGVTGRFSLNGISSNGFGAGGTSGGVNAANSSSLISFGNNALGGNVNNANAPADGAFSSTTPGL